MGSKKNLVGMKFNRLLVIKESDKRNNNYVTWECLCDCGKTTFVISNCLTKGRIKSCGCYKDEVLINRNTTHNMSKTKIYRVWRDIVRRTTDKKHSNYKKYGAKGITISSEWLVFENFLKDMGLPPSDKHEVDRINNNLGYSRNNCRWATRSQNMHNTHSKKNSTSKYKGVSYNKKNNKWSSNICKDGKTYRLGDFNNEVDAAIIYNKKAIELYGEFANLNIIENMV